MNKLTQINRKDMFSSYLRKFAPTEEQKILINSGNRSICCAGPGSGKSTSLLGKALKLLKNGLNSEHIVFLMYSKTAEENLRDKIKKLFPKKVFLEFIHITVSLKRNLKR